MLEHDVESQRREESALRLGRAFEALFTGNHDAPLVLRDLCRFAGVFEPDGNLGRREVVLRILHLSGIDRKMIKQLGEI